MPDKCTVCKHAGVAGDGSRSFHKFPNKHEPRQKWMDALGINKVLKQAKVCSDHFDVTSFHDTNGYTTVRRLKSTAVPSLRLDNTATNHEETGKDGSQQTNTTDDSCNTSASGEQNQNEDSSRSKPDAEAQPKETASSEVRQDNLTNNAAPSVDPTPIYNAAPTNCEARTHDAGLGEKVGQSSDQKRPSTSGEKKKPTRKLVKRDITSTPHDNDIIGESSEESSSEESESDSNSDLSNNLKRKHSPDDAHTNPEKKIRLRTGPYKYVRFSQKDFTDSEKWKDFQDALKFRNRLIKTTQTRNRRFAKKIDTFKELVGHLKKQNATSAAEYLQDLPPHVQELITRMKSRPKTKAFPAHLKSSARTLHFHSPAAYNMVRTWFLKALPCPNTLNAWACSKHFKPGMSEETIDQVAEIVAREKTRGKKNKFALIFDEVYIKECQIYNTKTHEWEGSVDLGGQLEEKNELEEDLPAKKALVYMLVNINGSFKAPVAYYLVNSLNGCDKSILLKDLLIVLHKKDIDVLSVTFDGDDSNQKACTVMGANFDYTDENNFKPYIIHPSDKLKEVFIFFDPCHMLKLVRNYFAQKGPLIYNGKEFIDWKYIRWLNNKQYEEEMHCACKIKNRHVNFYNEKMKVFLAAQTLSNSTAQALYVLECKYGCEEFKGAGPTLRFCSEFNDMFDLLNTKNRFCKTPGRRAITKETLPDIKERVEKHIDYIKKLEVDVKIKSKSGDIIRTERKPVLKASATRTGFLGFIICLKNLVALCESLFEDEAAAYFLSCKLSQDHVEMFFALIRRMGGFNNNPTTVQFQSAYKKLLLNSINVVVPSSANCTPQDNTFLITMDLDMSKNESLSCDDDENIAIPDTHPKNVQKDRKALGDIGNNNQQQSLKGGQNGFPNEQFPKPKKITQKIPKSFDLFDIDNLIHRGYGNLSASHTESCSWAEDEYLQDVIRYTAGAVIHSVRKRVHCEKCLQSLKGKVSHESHLTTARNRGGLTFAPDDVVLICKKVETVLRRYKNNYKRRDINHKVVTETLEIIPPSVLQNDEHMYDQEFLYDHRQQLIYLIIQNYADKRLAHESAKERDKDFRIRIKLTKTIHFSGQ